MASQWKKILTSGGVVNADLSGSAGITSANILNGTLTDDDISGSAGIAYDKLDLEDSVVAADITDNAIDSSNIVQGAIDLGHMTSQSVDEDNLYISNSGSNGQFLSKQSGNNGGMTWASSGAGTVTSVGTNTGLSGTVTTTGSLSLALDNIADMTESWANLTDEFIVLDDGIQKKKLSGEIFGNNAFNSTAFTTNTGTVTSVGTNTGLSGTVTTTGSLSLALDDLADMTQDWVTGTDEFIVLDDGTQKKKQSSEIFGSNAFNSTTIPTNNNQLTNGAGYTTNTGTVTSVATGTGLSGGTFTTSGTISVDRAAVTNGATTLANGNDIYDFVIGLGYTTNTGTITSVGAGAAIDLSGSLTAPVVDLDLSELSTSTADGDGDFFVVVDTSNAQKKLTKANIALSGMNNDSGWTSSSGTITGSGTDDSYARWTSGSALEARTASQVLSDISGAAKGANSDITSLTGLTTDLTAAQGGTGVSSIGALKNLLDDETWTFANSVTVPNMAVTGNISMTGTSTITNITTEELYLEDNSIVLNAGNGGVAVDAGFIVEMGSTSNTNEGMMFDVVQNNADDTSGRWVRIQNTETDVVTSPTYISDFMQVRIDGSYASTSSKVPVGHLQYDAGELYLRVENS